MVVYPAPYKRGLRDDGAWRWLATAGMTFNSVPVTVSTICRISFVCAQARIEAEKCRATGADDLTGIAHLEVDVWVILRRFSPNALELAAANAHDRHPDFIMKLRITFHLQRAA